MVDVCGADVASSMCFIGRPVLEDGTVRDYASARRARESPLALKLFEVNGVSSVLLGADFVSVSVQSEVGHTRTSLCMCYYVCSIIRKIMF